MENRKVFLSTVVVLSLIAAGLVAVNSLNENTSKEFDTDEFTEGDYNVTEDGTKYTLHPDNLIQGCSGRDCIPSIENPTYISSSQADWLDDEDLVIGVDINGDQKAYPLRILNLHEIVNTRVGGEPVAVTYCPLCRSGLVYSRELNNQELEFGVSGKLYNANLVMYDRQTETYWQQIGGEAIVGPLVPAELELISSELTEWKKWKQANPETEVLSRETGIYPKSSYSSSPYPGYEEQDEVGFRVGEIDDRLHSKKIVYGVTLGSESKAYTEEKIEEENLIQDTVGGIPVMLIEDQEDGGISVFSRKIDGKTLNFSVEDDALLDQEGNRWDFNGEAKEGDFEGKKLDELNSHGFYWFAWSKFHPETSIYGE